MSKRKPDKAADLGAMFRPRSAVEEVADALAPGGGRAPEPPDTAASTTAGRATPAAPEPSTPTVEAPRVRWKRTVSTRADGSQVKRLTIFLPVELARRLAERADDEGRPMGAIIADALEGHLGKRRA